MRYCHIFRDCCHMSLVICKLSHSYNCVTSFKCQNCLRAWNINAWEANAWLLWFLEWRVHLFFNTKFLSFLKRWYFCFAVILSWQATRYIRAVCNATCEITKMPKRAPRNKTMLRSENFRHGTLQSVFAKTSVSCMTNFDELGINMRWANRRREEYILMWKRCQSLVCHA